MDAMVMTVRAHDAPDAMYRMIRPAPDGRRRAKDPGPAAFHDEQPRQRSCGCAHQRECQQPGRRAARLA